MLPRFSRIFPIFKYFARIFDKSNPLGVRLHTLHTRRLHHRLPPHLTY